MKITQKKKKNNKFNIKVTHKELVLIHTALNELIPSKDTLNQLLFDVDEFKNNIAIDNKLNKMKNKLSKVINKIEVY